MTITALYNQAVVDETLFLQMTGITKEKFALLLPYFKINCAKNLSTNQQLFAILYAEKTLLDSNGIGKLIPYAHCKRDGQKFLDQAKPALAEAEAAATPPAIIAIAPTNAPVNLVHLPQLSAIKAKKSRRIKTAYDTNITMGLACHANDPMAPEAIIEHAQRRVDLFFYTLIVYYKTGLTVHLDETKLQHGTGNGITAACHSAILPSLWDTEIIDPLHPQGRQPTLLNIRTSILDDTHFYQSLNSTVELHQAVNYFETHYLEGKKSENKMRSKSLEILNRVSQATITPIQGVLEFLIALNALFDEVRDHYLNKEELKTSPVTTRSLIFDCEKKGSFYSKWHENKGEAAPTLNDDYVNTLLRLSKEDLALLKKQANETPEAYLERFDDDQTNIYEKRYTDIKQEIGLELKLSPELPNLASKAAVTHGLVAKRGFFSTPNIKCPDQMISPNVSLTFFGQ